MTSTRKLTAGAVWLVLALTHGTAAESTRLVVVREGAPAATVVLPSETEFDRYTNAAPETIEGWLKDRFPNATPAKLEKARKALPRARAAEARRVGDEEKLAASELVEFIRKMSGAELPLVRLRAGEAPPSGNLILLGAELAKAEGLSAEIAALSPDGLIARVKGERLILTGQRARGTLYAVYEFLESLGCRWIMPGEFGEIVPQLKTIETGIDVTANPSHSRRYWWCTHGAGDGYARWTLRNKGNFVHALGEPMVRQNHASQVPLEYGAHRTERGILVRKTVSDWKRDEKGQIIRNEKGQPIERVMVEKEVKQLPDEYYALQEGKPNLHLANMSNPKVWELCAEYYRDEYFYAAPLEDYASISAADGIVSDDRRESRMLDSNEFDWTIGAMTATDRLWFFHRCYLEEVVKEHPKRKFGVLVYANNMTPPRLETVHPSMALVFAPLTICPLHHVRDPQCKTNRAYRQWFEAWMAQKRAAGAEAYYYDYLPIGFQWCNFILSPQWHIVGENYPWFHALGLDGHTSQGFDDWGAMGLTAWVAERLYWNVQQDYRDLIREYCALRFGSDAAAAMHAYYQIFEDRMREIPDLCSNEIWGNHLAVDAATRARARVALHAAAERVQGERAKRHYQAVVDFQTAMDAWCDGIEHARETGDFGAAAEMMERSFQIAEKLNRLYSHYVNPKTTSQDAKAQYTPGGWIHKYRVWDARIKGSKASVVLPRRMKVALDTDNLAHTKGWHKPEVSLAELEDWDSTVVPDVKYQTEREVAAFFYRTEVEVPASFAGSSRTTIYFPSLIARGLRIWINGQPVSFDNGGYQDEIWRGPAYFWMNYDHQQMFDITGLLRPGRTNTIAFRVFKSFDHAGTYDRVFLLADPKQTE